MTQEVSFTLTYDVYSASIACNDHQLTIIMCLQYRPPMLLISHMIFSFFNDKAPLVPKYSGVSSLEVLRPPFFLIRFFNRMLHPFIFLIRFSNQISLLFSVHKLAFQILINTYELDFVASTSFTIYLKPCKLTLRDQIGLGGRIAIFRYFLSFFVSVQTKNAKAGRRTKYFADNATT